MAELDKDVMKELLQTFRDEGAEYVQVMNQSLLHTERAETHEERQGHLQAGLRAAHSLKGAARAVNLLALEKLTHSVESLLQRAHKGQLTLDAAIADTLYDAFDLMTVMVAGDEPDTAQVLAKVRDLLGEESTADVDSVAQETYAQGAEYVNVADGGDETIRVSVDKLDDLMAQVGELLVAKISAEQRLDDVRQIRLQIERWPKLWREIKMLLPGVGGERGKHLSEILMQYAESVQMLSKDFEHLDQQIHRDARRLEMVANTLQERVRQVRMVPFATLSLLLERTVRDAARSTDKEIDFVIQGKMVELDKKVLEALKDPLLHLLRNAAYHGIESVADRAAAGKPEVGRIEVEVQQRGNEVQIVVRDDGRGFDTTRLRQRNGGAEHGGGSNGHGASFHDDAIEAAFLPGVSTADEVNEIAGRGIGLDVVRKRIESIRGHINVETVGGEGTAITITAPTSLAITRALLLQLSQERYVIPLLSVEKIVVPNNVTSVGGKLLLNVDDMRLPLYPLTSILERAPSGLTLEEQLALVVSVGSRRIAVLVDDVLTEVELSIMPLSHPLRNVRNVLGAALLGNGDPVVMVNPAHLIQSARGLQTSHVPRPAPKPDDAQADRPRPRVLVVDDSITTRTLEKNILLMAGYDVTTATNGREALQELAINAYDIVISDVQMPHMDGIELARAIRSQDAFKHLPLILVTSLESQTDRERGLNAGANAYIVKRGFDQEVLLKTIGQLV